MTAAWMNGSPVVVLAGRAPQARWGVGLVAGARSRPDRRVRSPSAPRPRHRPRRSSPRSTPRAAPRARRTAGPTFVDIPLDAFGPGDVDAADGRRRRGSGPSPTPTRSPRSRSWSPARAARCSSRAATCTGPTPSTRCARSSSRRAFPTFVNGMGRGTLPADHELAFSRARSLALKQADLVLVAGTPLDFRLGFGRFGDAQVVHLCDARVAGRARTPSSRRRPPAISQRRSPRWPSRARRATAARRLGRAAARRRAGEARGRDAPMLEADTAPIKPGAHLRRAAQAARPRRDRHR